jgi:hypothetical protein
MSHLKRFVILALAALLWGGAARAAPLAFSIVQADRIVRPNTVEVFSGTILNGTGADLNTGSLFFDFFNIFDPAQLSFTQLLGTPDLPLPDGSTSGTVDLFSVEIGSITAADAPYFADVTLQSVNGDISDTATVQLSAVPELSVAMLLWPGLGVLYIAIRRRGRRSF